jgi:hypothetical protein
MSPTEKQALAVATGVTEIVISTQAEMVQATETLSTLNKHAKAVKEKKDEVMRPALDVVAAERKRWKPIEDMLEKSINHIRSQMSKYQI